MRIVWLATIVVGLATAQAEDDNGTYGFGRTPIEAEIKALDIDVMADGTGLPDGEGTVAKGEELYYQLCASCHGVTGTEGPNDVLVGREPREGFPFATTTTPSCRPTRRLSRWATSWVSTTLELAPMRESTVSSTLRSSDCASAGRSTVPNARR